MNIFEELRRRNVFKVGIAYLIGAWLLLQIADVVLNNIAAPGWVFKAIMLVVAIGLPISLFFAWAFELTPEGIKKEKDVDRSRSITNKTGLKLNFTIIAVLVVAVGFLLFERDITTPASPDAAATGTVEIDKSIAVLPFVNMSADADNEYFSDGLSEELLNLLAKVDGLKVAARTSTFKFRNSDADIAEIGTKLNVATILEGSVRKAGNQVRITAQLIKVDDGFHLWSETYDRNLDNIFEVQDEIATAIVDALKLPLLGRDAQPLSAASTDNFAAYDLYLLGRHHSHEFTDVGYERAIDYYQRALAIDPSFAQAYSGLADAYALLSNFGDMPLAKALQLAQAATEKALALNPGLPEVQTSMGRLSSNHDRLSEAESHYKKALLINPNHVDAILQYRDILNSRFRFSEALAMSERAVALDPLSNQVRRAYTDQLIKIKRFDDAMSLIQSFIAGNPDDPSAYELWGDMFRNQGLPHRAIPMYRNAHRLRPGDIYMAAYSTLCSLQMDDANLAGYWLAQARSRGADGQWTRFAENALAYATGQHAQLLLQADQLLQQQPGQSGLLFLRGAALMHLGQFDNAQTAFRSALAATGFNAGQPLQAEQVWAAIQLANTLDSTDEYKERNGLINEAITLLETARNSEPPDRRVLLLSAIAASVNGDLDGLLQHLGEAVAHGFRDHWELIENPVFKRWQDNEDFKVFHQNMLEAAAGMRREYRANNPTPATESPG